MKKLTILLAILVAIGGCSKEVREVPVDQLVERGGVYYEVNSQTPFTGSAVGYLKEIGVTQEQMDTIRNNFLE